jgi:hypothetical protein
MIEEAQKVMNNLLPLLEQYSRKLDDRDKENRLAYQQAQITYGEPRSLQLLFLP